MHASFLQGLATASAKKANPPVSYILEVLGYESTATLFPHLPKGALVCPTMDDVR